MPRLKLELDLNRVEGDVTFQVEVEEGSVVEARCVGTTYRGFEQIMVGRAPRDALVITPRICGICSTAHLYAASPMRDAIVAAFAPFQGWMHRETLRYSRRIIEIVALLARQWPPHSSHIAPGGVTAPATARHLVDSQSLVTEVTRWVEQRLLGGDLDDWLAPAMPRAVAEITRLLGWGEAT